MRRWLVKLRRPQRLNGLSSNLLLASRFPEYSIGTGSYGDVQVLTFGEEATLKVGAYCSFANGVQIMLGGEHRMDWVTTYPFSAVDDRFRSIPGHPKTKGDVTIGNDVWVGREAMILSGVSIGDGAVIGARAVVSRSVPPYTIVAGNPAAAVRLRHSDDHVQRLQAIRWWDWPSERIDAAVPYLLSDDVEAFLDAAENGRL